MPIRLVDMSGFQKLMKLVCPSYEIPSRHLIKKDLDDIYQ